MPSRSTELATLRGIRHGRVREWDAVPLQERPRAKPGAAQQLNRSADHAPATSHSHCLPDHCSPLALCSFICGVLLRVGVGLRGPDRISQRGYDLRYSQILLVAAGVGLTAGLACAAWLACKQSTGAIVAETWAACFGVAFFAGDHAHPIHLFPTGGPLLEAFAATGAVLATALVATHLAVRGRLPNTHKAPRSQ